MSAKQSDLTREELEQLIVQHQLQPALRSQNPYIANGPDHELLACRQPDGRYSIQLLDKKQVEESVQDIIREFREYAARNT
jgi:hypothetical protein